MRPLGYSLVCGVALVLASAAALAQTPAGQNLLWAFPVASAVVNKPPSPLIKGPQRISGSTQRYTQEQLDRVDMAVDWFPKSHAPMPAIVRDGARDGGWACGSCHLANGMGHPESADLTGLSPTYFMKTMGELRSGARKDPIRMTAIAKALSVQDLRQAAAYFATLKPVPHWTKVVETNSVPKTYLGPGRMRFIDPAGGREPIGDRIITVPQNVLKARARDPRSGFIAYVPPGSLQRGKALARGAGGTLPSCASCHGAGLKGKGAAPMIAGQHPIYLARQLYDFKTGARNGPDAQLMKPIAAALNDKDIIALSAYVASLRR
ncbi:MAG TPA: c-type cytochrome [Caulobacteraceae bacterium]|nr:c-type cytochrome [Caulobacteraceae bacterium]